MTCLRMTISNTRVPYRRGAMTPHAGVEEAGHGPFLSVRTTSCEAHADMERQLLFLAMPTVRR